MITAFSLPTYYKASLNRCLCTYSALHRGLSASCRLSRTPKSLTPSPFHLHHEDFSPGNICFRFFNPGHKEAVRSTASVLRNQFNRDHHPFDYGNDLKVRTASRLFPRAVEPVAAIHRC